MKNKFFKINFERLLYWAIFFLILFNLVYPLVETRGDFSMIPHIKNYKIKFIISIPFSLFAGFYANRIKETDNK